MHGKVDAIAAEGYILRRAEPSRAEPSRAEPSRAEPSRAEPSRAEPSRAEPSRAEPSRAEPSRAEPSRAEPSRAEPSRAEPRVHACCACRVVAVALLGAALFVLNVVPAQAQVVWFATLTVDESGVYFGCDNSDSQQANCSTNLTDDDFTYKGVTYTVPTLYLRGATLLLQFANTPPGGGEWELWVDSALFVSSAATVEQTGKAWEWTASGITWTDGQRVRVSLEAPHSHGPRPGTPTLTPVTSGGNGPTATTHSFTIECVSPGKAPVTDYYLWAENTTDNSVLRHFHTVPSPCRTDTVTLTGLTPGTQYRVRVLARNLFARMSQWSSWVQGTTYAMQVRGGGNPDDPTTDSLTASFEDVPAEHSGKAFTIRVRLSETVGNFSKSPRASSFEVTQGHVRKVKQVDAGLWQVRVRPSSWRAVEVTLAGGRGCDEAGAVCTPDGRPLSNSPSATIGGPVRIRIEGARGREGRDATLDFAVELNRAAAHVVSVDYATIDGTATAGEDYTATSGALTFAPGTTKKTVTVPILDDAVDEGKEKFTLRLSNPQGAYLRKKHREATGIIVNEDPLPEMWLSRFGRTAAGHTLEAVAERLNTNGAAAAQATVAGHPVSRTSDALLPTSGLTVLRDGQAGEEPRTMQLHELLASSSFHLAAAPAGAHIDDGGRWSLWGRGAWSQFEGTEDDLKLDGKVLTATAGADYEQDRLLAGLAVSYSSGSGTYDQPSMEESGKLGTTLLGVHPYVRLTLHQRLAVWGLFGYAVHGTLTLDREGADAIDTGTGLVMGAFGARGTLVEAAHSGGFELAARTDGLLLRAHSDEAEGLAASAAEVQRLRLLLNASYVGVRLGGGVLTPALEVGGRYDGGDAETGAGLVVGGSLAYTVPAWGLSLAGSGRGLLVHEHDGFREWSAGGSLRLDPGTPGRGLALSVQPSWGTATAATGEHLWSLPDASAQAANAGSSPDARLAAELSYGTDAFGGGGVLTPYAGLALAGNGERTWSLGSRLRVDPGLSLSLLATRAEPAGTAPNHAVTISGSLHGWDQ